MPFQYWYDTVTGERRYLQELQVIKKRIISPKILKQDGLLRVEGYFLHKDVNYQIVILFPPVYPEMAPKIWVLRNDMPLPYPDVRFAPHINYDGSVCLFTNDWGSDGWHSELTLSQVLDRLAISIEKAVTGTQDKEHFSIRNAVPGQIKYEEVYLPSEIAESMLKSPENSIHIDLFSFEDERPTKVLLLPPENESTKSLLKKIPWNHYKFDSNPAHGLCLKVQFPAKKAREKIGTDSNFIKIISTWGWESNILENNDFILIFFTDTKRHDENLRDPSVFDPFFSYLFYIKDFPLDNIYKIPLHKVIEVNIPNDCFQRTFGVLDQLITSLKRKTITFVGLGTLGSEIALELAKTGITNFILYDFETLQPVNVCRHTGDLSDLGQSKANLVMRQIKYRNPLANVTPYNTNPFASPYIVEFIENLRKSDVVILTTGNHQTAMSLNSLALTNHVSVVYAWCGSNAEQGRIFRVIPLHTPCYNCICLRMEMEPLKYPRIEPLHRETDLPQFEGYREPGIPGISIDINFIALFAARFTLQTLLPESDMFKDCLSDHYIWQNRGFGQTYLEYPNVQALSFKRVKTCSACNTRALTRARDPKILQQIHTIERSFT